MATDTGTTQTVDRETLKPESTTTQAKGVQGGNRMDFTDGCSLERVEGGWLYTDRNGGAVIPNEIAAQVGSVLSGQGSSGVGNTS